MCTVTIVPHDGGLRVLCNRDERRTRQAAKAVTVRRLGERRAIFPVDPVGGGTWIGVNDAGIIATLLNRTAKPQDAAVDRSHASRGLIVPQLLACSSITEALDRMTTVRLSDFAPFRLAVIEGTTAAIVTSDGTDLRTEPLDVSRPALLTSSSLGDSVVEPPRRDLFDRLLGRSCACWLHRQARFHRHQWAARPDISVMMERPDARTVSRTTVDVGPLAAALIYEPLDRPPATLRAA